MASRTVDIPDDLNLEVDKILKAELADDEGTPSALTGRALWVKWVSTQLQPKLRAAYRRANVSAAISKGEEASETAKTALAAENAARVAAEIAEDTKATTDLATIT